MEKDAVAGGALAGKTVMVTGAGAGIGRAICVDCARQGADVVVVSRGDNGEDTAASALAHGGRAEWVRADVTVRLDVEDAVRRAVDAFGGLDAVVHNATSRLSSRVEAIEAIRDDEWDDHVAVSLRGAFHCARAAFPHLVERHGRFVVMTSPAAMEGSSTLPAYAAVKGALRGFAKALALEWGPSGVTVAALSPLARTPALDRAFDENTELESRLRRLVPVGRIGDSLLDVAPVASFLLSDAARYITGQTIVVDGGRSTTL